MFTLAWTTEAEERFYELEAAAKKVADKRTISGKTKSSNQEGLFNQLTKTLKLLRENPRHPGLKTHIYHIKWDGYGKVFEAYVQNHTPGAYRVFWSYGPGTREITILAISPHP